MIILSRLFFSTARRTNQEAPPQLSGFGVCRRSRRRGLRNSLRSDSPRPFSSVSLATSPPDKGGIGGSCLYSNPPLLLPLLVFLIPLLVATLLSSPLYFLAKTQGRRVRVTLRSLQCDTPAYGARQGRSLEVALYSFAMNKRSGLYFSNSTPSSPPIFPYGNTGGEEG